MNNETVCREIYREAFHDENEVFENELFKYCSDYICTFEDSGNPVSMLFALPCTVFTADNKELDAFYIFAAATKSEFRGKGYMKKLLNSLKAEGKLLFLRPADESLIKFYKSCGFTTFTATNTEASNCRAVPFGGFSALSNNVLPDTDKSFTAMYYYKDKLSLENLYFPFTIE